jgi:hypothetical protein
MRPASIALAVASSILLFLAQQAHADDPWSNSRYQLGGGNNSRQANQYGATIGSGAPSATQAPSPLDRAQNAVVGTAGTLRDGVEAGIRQANQTGGQIVSGTASAGRDLGQQFQSATGLDGQSQPSSSNTWPAPPPTPSSPTNAGALNGTTSRTATTTSSSGWTSIHSDMAPPTLLAPPLVPLSNSSSGSFSSSTSAGPSFPTAPPAGPSFDNSKNQRDQFHSLLADPSASSRQNSAPAPAATSSAARAPDWSSGWGTNAPSQPSLGGASDTAFGRGSGPSVAPPLPRVAPEVPRSTTGGFANDTDPWNRPFPDTSTTSSPASSAPSNNPLRGSASAPTADDRYNPAPATSQNGSSIWAGLPAPSAASPNAPLGNLNSQPGLNNQPSTGFGNFPNQSNMAQPNLGPSPAGQNVAGQPLLNRPNPTQPGGNMSTLGFGNQNGLLGPQSMNQEQVPWMPLLAVSLTLAGSLGANLYLGWSYADARHRYHLLVRRSTESFHKATGIAA